MSKKNTKYLGYGLLLAAAAYSIYEATKHGKDVKGMLEELSQKSLK